MPKKITTFDLFLLIFVCPFGWSVFEKESLDISKFHKSAEMSLSCQFSDKTWIDKEIHLKVQRKHTLTRFPQVLSCFALFSQYYHYYNIWKVLGEPEFLIGDHP